MLDHKGLTAMEARRRGMSKPGESKSAGGMTRPHDQEPGGEGDAGGGAGDGNHHHELHEDKESGMWHSTHTHPDGRVETGDHTSYSDAKDHMDAMHGETEDDESHDDHSGDDEPDGDEPEDLASMYDSD